MFEHLEQPLISRAAFFGRMIRHAAFAFGVVFAALGLGILGYHELEGLPWIDALLNASMILGGMGPINELHTVAGKLFASAYALFSGLVFVVTAGLLFVPVVHRLLHHFHVPSDGEDSSSDA